MSNRSLWRVVVVILTLALTFATFAKNEVAKAVGGGSQIEWQVSISGHQSIDLVVLSESGDRYSKSFNAGRNPSFRLMDLGGAPEDGVYNYELRVNAKVPAGIAKKLSDARAANDDAAIKKIMKEAGLGSQVVQSGHFTISGGNFVATETVEKDANDAAGPSASGFNVSSDAISSNARPSIPVTLDQVIPDDLIVQGSICTGFDCVNGESFGADTLRLKENNLRIHFEDTSTSAGFPANDWRIVANDQASGGGNFLSIEDSTAGRNVFVAEAGAPSNALYVDSTGNIGLSQSAPGLDLHITTSDTPAMRYEQTNAGGFTAQTWDIGANEANFFVRDVTGGSRLSFRIRPGAPTSSIDISSDGDVGIGTASPERKLHVLGVAEVTTFPTPIGTADILVLENNGNTNMSLIAGTGGTNTIRLIRDGATSSNGFIQYNHSNDSLALGAATATRVTITSTAMGIGNTTPNQPLIVGVAGSGSGGNGAHVTAGGTWTNGSSREFKENVLDLSAEDANAALATLHPVRYNYKAEPNEEYVGFIAEDVPELVAQTSTGRQYLSPMDIVATLTKVVQEQQKTIDELSKKVDALESQK